MKKLRGWTFALGVAGFSAALMVPYWIAAHVLFFTLGVVLTLTATEEALRIKRSRRRQ